MPELSEQMYCSEQICIPPAFPYLLRQFAKAAIRSQPTDLLRWATAYFRCLSLNIPPPIKPRLEYPVPRDHCGVTPGWLKALLYQLSEQPNCIVQDSLGQMDGDLTHTMILICEIMSEEPEGGSAMIPLETFTDLYKFLANIDASKPQVLKNMYFTDSLLSLWREKIEKDLVRKHKLAKKAKKRKSKKKDSKEIISCPSIAGDDDYSIDYYVDVKDLEGEGGDEPPQEPIQEETAEELQEQDVKSEISKHSEESEAKVSQEASEKEDERSIKFEEEEEGETFPEGTEEVQGEAVEQSLEPVPYESVDTIQEEPRRIEPENPDQERMLREDLERLKALHQELPGEMEDEVERFKCRLIAEVPLTQSQEDAIVHFTQHEEERGSEGESEEGMGQVLEEDLYEDVFIDVIPGIDRWYRTIWLQQFVNI
ncbi:hypothetical protein NQ314_018776 [Rhamnusium bicolor]|uniref:Uncharacterized protein n=1 Tax=Rhamnusium bicolor TaxID=1586634 RepID=A0AAV8WR32_9CUCU|nr:hypothetical protein NQ314_018776 [Rhamnusium bicolor]